MNAIFSSRLQTPQKLITQTSIVGALVITSILTGLAPSLSWQHRQFPISFSTVAQAQEISNDEISNYARAVLAIEPRRQQASQEIQNRSGSVPPVICNETRQINRLPKNIRGIAVNYCEQAKQIIESQNLTISRFNEITLQQKQDANLRQRIQEELIRQQQQGGQS